jgi:hypothetical protein
MVLRSKHQELTAAWRALAAEAESGEGWHTIPLAGESQFGMQAGRRFPGNEEALLLAFSRSKAFQFSELIWGAILTGVGLQFPGVRKGIWICSH